MTSRLRGLGGSHVGCNTTKENEEVVIGSRHESHCLYGKQLMHYTTKALLFNTSRYSLVWGEQSFTQGLTCTECKFSAASWRYVCILKCVIGMIGFK